MAIATRGLVPVSSVRRPRREHWRALFEAQRRSGLSLAAFSRPAGRAHRHAQLLEVAVDARGRGRRRPWRADETLDRGAGLRAHPARGPPGRGGAGNARRAACRTGRTGDRAGQRPACGGPDRSSTNDPYPMVKGRGTRVKGNRPAHSENRYRCCGCQARRRRGMRPAGTAGRRTRTRREPPGPFEMSIQLGAAVAAVNGLSRYKLKVHSHTLPIMSRNS